MKRKKAGVRLKQLRPSFQSESNECWLKAIYGADRHNPLMWSLMNTLSELRTCRVIDKHAPLITSLFMRAVSRNGLRDADVSLGLGFFEAASKALLEKNAEFFRETARLLDLRIDAPPEQKMDAIVNRCFTLLELRKEGSLPTKKEVRESALGWLANQNMLGRKSRSLGELFSFNADGMAELSPDPKAEVKKELQWLKLQDKGRHWNWTQIFKRCGLSHLPNDKGGKPSHTVERYD